MDCKRKKAFLTVLCEVVFEVGKNEQERRFSYVGKDCSGLGEELSFYARH